ncbi:MAG: GntR family transcriptional regulator [Geminicoccaceae bacterium]
MGFWAKRKAQNIAEVQGRRVGGLSEEDIIDRIFEAVIEQRLPPGTKLSESALGKAFGVGRMRIRRSLLLLASRDIVDLQSNRGAYVSSPTKEQAREVFEARRAIEPNVCRFAIERSQEGDIRRLEQLLEEEQDAHVAGDRRSAIRLSGLFHVNLAEMAANHVMERMVKELVTRTSLIIGLFGAAGTANCHVDEHKQLLQAIKNRRSDEAAQHMVAHLEHIEAQVDLSTEHHKNVDLVEMFMQS